MKIRIITVGKLRESSLKALESDYVKRLPRYLSLEFDELKPPKTSSEQQQKDKEAEIILARISPQDAVFALSEEGKGVTSVEFSSLISRYLDNGCSVLTMIIGGAFGLSPSVKSRANKILSLSKLTHPHQLARIILVEQIYRASTLRDNIPYHK
jgi:23S rRNA (pseudouridine1915-N3)-methyltransferase